MSIFIDRKYLGLIQYRLERFSQKKLDLYNFRCPFCLDSKKNKSKTRGYIYKLNGIESYAYRCHNCGKSISFGHFLEAIDGTAYKQYVLEKYCAGNNRNSPVAKPDFEELRGNAFEQFESKPKTLSLSRVSELPEKHYARAYIEYRRIPEKAWNEIYYTEKFRDFMDADFPNHGKADLPNDDRIVMIFADRDGKPTVVSGRALGHSKMRYVSVKVGEHVRKLFGTQRLDITKPAFVVEGQFDSLFLDNCVATGDSHLVGATEVFPEADWTLIFDNEPRNKEIVRELERAIDKGYKVCIFPDTTIQKDLNDMVLAGVDVKSLVANNTYEGVAAMLQFIRWKRV